jgi:hypothetical protein
MVPEAGQLKNSIRENRDGQGQKTELGAVLAVPRAATPCRPGQHRSASPAGMTRLAVAGTATIIV